jgi:uncharacterized protein YciI
MAHYILFYDYVPDILEKRGPHRAGHLALAKEAVAGGAMVLAGAFADPVDGAAFLWSVADPAPIEAFVAADPYVAAGLVTSWRIRLWTTVVGQGASSPV